ncbi:SAG family member [Eimeria brunetti]|uniref:SAG family member n=1 Tax=Eimeria brunetti TaxID=51314 RepID=U6L8W5_9EIME|nr:SAG family member [Eimeria brunetti]
MAPFYGTAAAVCLVALSGIRGVAAQQDAGQTTYTLKVQEVTEDAYLAVNLARNGNLPVHIKEVTEEKNLVSKLKEVVTQVEAVEAEPDVDEPSESCKTLINSEHFNDAFRHAFEYPTGDGATPNYRQTLQEALNAGLNLFQNKYPEDTEAWTTIWSKDAGASLGYLLGSNSTQIGCVIGRCTKVTTQGEQKRSSVGKAARVDNPVETPTNKAVLLCQLEPPAAKDTAPFDEAYFTGLIARTTELANMTEEDLKAPTNDGTAVAAVPTILFAGLLAMLTAISA